MTNNIAKDCNIVAIDGWVDQAAAQAKKFVLESLASDEVVDIYALAITRDGIAFLARTDGDERAGCWALMKFQQIVNQELEEDCEKTGG